MMSQNGHKHNNNSAANIPLLQLRSCLRSIDIKTIQDTNNCDQHELFDRIVIEYVTILYTPGTKGLKK